MPRLLPLHAAMAKLPEIMAGMTPGDKLELTQEGEVVAIMTVPEAAYPHRMRKALC